MAGNDERKIVSLFAEQKRRQSGGGSNGGVEGGGGGPHDPGMEARIKRLEDDYSEVRKDLKALTEAVSAVKERLAGIEGKLSHMPSTWVMVTTLAVSQVTLLGFTFALMRFFRP